MGDKVAKVGYYSEGEKITVVLPKNIFETDNIVGAMFYDLLEKLGWEIKVSRTESLIARDPSLENNFLLGFWFGFLSTSLHKRGRNKKNYELGRTLSFSMCVKAYFANHPSLGAKALVKDNWFYGNNTSESLSEKGRPTIPVPYMTPGAWSSQFTSGPAKELFGVLLHVAKGFQLQFLEAEALDNTIAANIASFDDVMRSFTRQIGPSIIRKDKKKAITIKKAKNPVLPRRSPLLINAEGEFIHKLLLPFWDPLDEIKKDYIRWIKSNSFEGLITYIRGVFNNRWSILTKYSTMTTKRLQELRKKSEELKNIRKATVSQQQAERIPKERQHPIDEFYKEITELIPEGAIEFAIGKLLGQVPESRVDAEILLCTEISLLYSRPELKVIPAHVPARNPATWSSFKSDDILHIKNTISALSGHVSEAITSLQGIPKWRSAAAAGRNASAVLYSLKSLCQSIENWEKIDLTKRMVVMRHPDIPVNSASEVLKVFLSYSSAHIKAATNKFDLLSQSDNRFKSLGEATREAEVETSVIGSWNKAIRLAKNLTF